MRTKLTNWFITPFILSAILVTSCNYNPGTATSDESPTSGKLKMGVDESFTLLSDAEIEVFQSIYPSAQITPIYEPELDVLNDFMNDTVRIMITSRKLNKQEEDYFQSKQIFPKSTAIAYDALAFIVNRKNSDSLIRYNTIKDIFTGKVTNWSQINNKNSAGKLKMVFDNINSANVRYIKEKFAIKDSFPKTCYSVKKNDEVVNYVESHPNAIGVVSVNWISDKHDSITRGFLKRIRVVAVSSDVNSDGIDFYKPYQGFIADKSYPFIREVYMISRETYTGLASGVMAFVTHDLGQRIVLKMGMVPATMPIRLIQTRNNMPQSQE